MTKYLKDIVYWMAIILPALTDSEKAEVMKDVQEKPLL